MAKSIGTRFLGFEDIFICHRDSKTCVLFMAMLTYANQTLKNKGEDQLRIAKRGRGRFRDFFITVSERQFKRVFTMIAMTRASRKERVDCIEATEVTIVTMKLTSKKSERKRMTGQLFIESYTQSFQYQL